MNCGCAGFISTQEENARPNDPHTKVVATRSVDIGQVKSEQRKDMFILDILMNE